MDRTTLIQRLNAGEPGYQIRSDLSALGRAETGRLCLQVIDTREAPAIAQSSFWTYLGAVPEEITAERFTSLIRLHDSFMQSGTADADYDQDKIFSGGSLGHSLTSGVWWERNLQDLLKHAQQDNQEMLLQAATTLPGKLAMGLRLQLALQGLLPHDALSDDIVEAVASGLTKNGVLKNKIRAVADLFADAPTRLWPRVAALGAELGAKTNLDIWWEHALEYSTPKQRAQWILNTAPSAMQKPPFAMAEAMAFARTHFGETELSLLIDLLHAGKDAPTNYNAPVWQSPLLASYLIADSFRGRDSGPTPREEEAFLIAIPAMTRAVTSDGISPFLIEALEAYLNYRFPGLPLLHFLGAPNEPTKLTIEQQRRAREAMALLPKAESPEDLVLSLLDKEAPERFGLLGHVTTPAVVDRALQICRDNVEDPLFVRRARGAFFQIPPDLRAPLVEALESRDDVPEFLQTFTTKVQYLTGPQARELFEDLQSEGTILVAPTFQHFLHSSFANDALRNRMPRHRYYLTVQEFKLDRPDPAYGQMMLADRDSLAAIEAATLDIPVIPPEAFPALLGPPLNHLPESLHNLLRRSRDNAELVHYHLGDPASEELIARVEEALGFALPEALKTFYKCFNGLSIYMVSHDDYDDGITDLNAPLPEQSQAIPWADFIDRTDGPIFPRNLARRDNFLERSPKRAEEFYFHTVNILPLEEVFLNNDWTDRFGRDDLFLFDAYEDERQALLQIYPEEQKILVRYKDEYLADPIWGRHHNPRRPLTLEEYLEQLLSNFSRRTYVDDYGLAESNNDPRVS